MQTKGPAEKDESFRDAVTILRQKMFTSTRFQSSDHTAGVAHHTRLTRRDSQRCKRKEHAQGNVCIDPVGTDHTFIVEFRERTETWHAWEIPIQTRLRICRWSTLRRCKGPTSRKKIVLSRRCCDLDHTQVLSWEYTRG